MKYQIKIRGRLDPSWSEWLGGLEIAPGEVDGSPFTILTGYVADQTALFSILTRMRDMNLTPTSFVQIDEEK
jgi:hypothetical protein